MRSRGLPATAVLPVINLTSQLEKRTGRRIDPAAGALFIDEQVADQFALRSSLSSAAPASRVSPAVGSPEASSFTRLWAC